MKKILTVCVLFLSLFIFSGCNDVNMAVNGAISETRDNYYCGKSGEIFCSLTDGRRESEFLTNGKPTKLLPYAIVLVKGNIKSLEATVEIDGTKKIVKLEHNPFDNTFVYDLEKLVGAGKNIAVTVDGQEITLNCLSSSWEVSQNKALNIFVKHNERELKKHVAGDKLDGEIFIKLVCDNKNVENVYYFIMCVFSDETVLGNVIDVMTGEIVQN